MSRHIGVELNLSQAVETAPGRERKRGRQGKTEKGVREGDCPFGVAQRCQSCHCAVNYGRLITIIFVEFPTIKLMADNSCSPPAFEDEKT